VRQTQEVEHLRPCLALANTGQLDLDQ
jgi:hypothetical protein